jgi:hypothetical protein
MLQCECGVALCVPCARTQVSAANGGDYREAAVACPKCQVGPICFTARGEGVETLRVGYNILCPADLPLGPLEALKFVEHKALDLYLHGQPVSNACCICFDPIAPGNTAFSMCMCAEVRLPCIPNPFLLYFNSNSPVRVQRFCGPCAVKSLGQTGPHVESFGYLNKKDQRKVRRGGKPRLHLVTNQSHLPLPCSPQTSTYFASTLDAAS